MDFAGDICPIDVITLRDGRCPECGWEPPAPSGELPKWDPRDDTPGIRGW